jgi:two-component system sensor histidine kinase VicK
MVGMKPSGTSPSDHQKTQVLYGVKNIIGFTLKRFSLIKEKSDTCLDRAGPSVLVTTKTIWDSCKLFKARGIKHRFITEITKDNLDYCIEIMKNVDELRHLDALRGNFSVSERDYQATAIVQESQPLSESMHTTVRAFVEQQQYVFETLWNKAIPAKQRIKEIEQGIKREFIDTIRAPNEIINTIQKVLISAIEELLLTFPTVNTFRRFENEGIFNLIKNQVTGSDKKVRILIDRGKSEDCDMIEQKFTQLTTKHPNFAIQYLSQANKIKVITVIADKELSLTIELKDDTKETITEAIGLATYSNSEATVLSYASIFETLWIQSELQQHEKDNR